MPTQDALAKYDQLIARHRGLIIKVCQIYCHRDMELARDLYQDIALKLWTEMDHFRGESSEATWLWHVAVNTAIDQIRERDYPEVLRPFSDNILLVGVSYDKDTKRHTCKIEQVTKE